MRRYDEHDRLILDQFEDLADLHVDVPEVMAHPIQVEFASSAHAADRITMLAEAAEKSIQPRIDKLKVVPGLGLHEMPHDAELSLASGVSLFGEVRTAIQARHLQWIRAHKSADFLGELRRLGERRVVVLERHDTADGDPADFQRRRGGGNPDEDRRLSCTGQVIPDGRASDG